MSDSLHHDDAVVRLQIQLQHVLQRCAELELQMLNSRDFALGQAAEIGGLRMRLERLNTDNSNHRAHIERLENALSEASQAVAQNVRLLERSRNESVLLRSSMTWKIGRFVMWPIRFFKRFARRS
jgi:chromosome segregation ATPase